MSKYIIFGAGNFGRRALKYYGSGSVVCFVDNNAERIGTDYCGKKVIGYEDLIGIKDKYTIIIATAKSSEIREQLDQDGIRNYICYTPTYEHFIEYMKRKIKLRSVESIILYGIDNDTSQIVEALNTLGLKDKILGVIESPYEQEQTYDKYKTYKKFDDAPKKVDCAIVAASGNNIALGAELKQHYEETLVINPYKQIAYYDTDEIIFNPYLTQTGELTEDDWNRNTENDLMKTAIRKYVEVVSTKVPLFEFIEIETINRCNGTCSFCPVNKLVDPRPKMKMTWELFKKIINELNQLSYSGEISLFSNNEPLLDDRIIEFHKYAREKLPNARIHMFTNGTLFNLPLFERLIPYLDELIIDNYQQELKLIRPSQEIFEYVEKHPELKNKVTIVLRKREEILTSRGGDAPNRHKKISFAKETCALPFEQMIVRPDGKVSLCCNDPIGKNTLGDLAKESIIEVWYGSKFKTVRECLRKGRANWQHCEFCDTFYLY